MITTLRIKGMTCNRCVRHVDQALRGVPGVTAVEVSLPEQRVQVDHDPSASLVNLTTAIESAGYVVVSG